MRIEDATADQATAEEVTVLADWWRLTPSTHAFLSRAAARRDVGLLTKAGTIEAVREGRGQVYRLR